MRAIPSLLIIAVFIYYVLISNGYASSPRELWRKRKESQAVELDEEPLEKQYDTADVVDYTKDGDWDGSEILGVSRENVVHVSIRPSLLAGAKPEERREWLAHRLAKKEFKTKTELVGAAAQEFGVSDRTIWFDLKEMDGK